jgi:hypothetical protein
MSVDHSAAAGGPAAKPSVDAAISRIVTRLSGEHVLRAFQLLIDSFGDIRAGVIVQAIYAANVAALSRTEEGRRAAEADGHFPDELRRPISISRLADSTGVPFETTRRIVRGLISDGVCQQARAGVIIPKSNVQKPEMVRNIIANIGYVRRLLGCLQTVGLAERAPVTAPPEPAIDDLATGRAVTVVSTEYMLRALQLLASAFGDVRAGIVVQSIITANTAHLDTRGGDGWRYAGEDEPPPDELRRPISIGRLAASLGFPYETMRQHVGRLVRADVCRQVEGGLIVPQAVLDAPDAAQARLANVGYVRKFVRDLHAIGL